MVASFPKEQQPAHRRLSPSSVLALTMLILMILAVYQTYHRAMVGHDFLVIDDTEEAPDEEL